MQIGTISMRSLSAMLVGAFTAAAAGQGVGPGSPTDTTHQFDTSTGVWWVGGPNDPGNMGEPYQVSLDPNGPWWRKTLTGSPQGPDGGPGVLHVHEFIELVPPPGLPSIPWTDWHQEIKTPGWAWTGATIYLAGDPQMEPIPGLQTMISPEGESVWFTFDPLVPSSSDPIVIEIWKDIEWVGPGPYIPGQPIEVWNYPTPTPSTIALMGLGGVAAMRRRRSE